VQLWRKEGEFGTEGKGSSGEAANPQTSVVRLQRLRDSRNLLLLASVSDLKWLGLAGNLDVAIFEDEFRKGDVDVEVACEDGDDTSALVGVGKAEELAIDGGTAPDELVAGGRNCQLSKREKGKGKRTHCPHIFHIRLRCSAFSLSVQR
jgi:hypothetical protein